MARGSRPQGSRTVAQAPGSLDRRFLLWLTVVAVATRLVWNLWVHPPDAHSFSDMAHYVARARMLAEEGLVPGMRTMAWQTYGTHYLLALPLRLFGSAPPYPAANLMWALMGAAIVPSAYLLASRVFAAAWMARAVGVAVLCWFPLLSNGGFFLAETPFALLQVLATYYLVVLAQSGRRGLAAGLVLAIAVAVRPQILLFSGLALFAWIRMRCSWDRVRAPALARVAVPLLLVLAFSTWRFHSHTGRWLGVAENATMNFTAARCHNVVTQAFPNERGREMSDARKSTSDGRRVSLPGFRVLSQLGESHPFALRPALGHESIKLVGYIGDPGVHREVRARCYERTGLLGQVRNSLLNTSLLWFWGYQWPEISDAKAPRGTLEVSVLFRGIFQWLVWLPSLWGVVLGLRQLWRREQDAVMGLLGLQMCVSMGMALFFFGTIRLRLPYDPFAIILAVWVYADLASRMRRHFSRPSG